MWSQAAPQFLFQIRNGRFFTTNNRSKPFIENKFVFSCLPNQNQLKLTPPTWLTTSIIGVILQVRCVVLNVTISMVEFNAVCVAIGSGKDAEFMRTPIVVRMNVG